MAYSQITTATAPVLSMLSPIEILARQREIAGYDTLNELEEMLARCSLRPGACHVVINGPDTLFISRSPAALEFLMSEVGFVRSDQPVVNNRVDQVTLSMPNYARCTEESADWKLFQRRLATGLRLVEWAKWANTSLVKIKVTDMLWDRQPAGPCGVEVKVKWVDVLGRDQGELFEYTGYRYAGQQPTVTEVFESKCDRACDVIFDVYRERVLMAKHVARGTVKYDNSGVLNEIIPLFESGFDPKAQGVDDAARKAHQRGCLRVEISSIRHRFALLEDEVKRATAQAELLAKQQPTTVTAAPPRTGATPPPPTASAPVPPVSQVVVAAPPASVPVSAAPSPHVTNGSSISHQDSTRIPSSLDANNPASPAPTSDLSPHTRHEPKTFEASMEREPSLDLNPCYVQAGGHDGDHDPLYTPGHVDPAEKPRWMRRRGSEDE